MLDVLLCRYICIITSKCHRSSYNYFIPLRWHRLLPSFLFIIAGLRVFFPIFLPFWFLLFLPCNVDLDSRSMIFFKSPLPRWIRVSTCNGILNICWYQTRHQSNLIKHMISNIDLTTLTPNKLTIRFVKLIDLDFLDIDLDLLQ